jgi:hypothetical protein
MRNSEYSLPLGELNFISKLKYDLLLTVTPRNPNFFGRKSEFKTAHCNFAFNVYKKVCKGLKIPRKRFLYFARSEFGESSLAHLHILYTFDKYRKHHKYEHAKSSLQGTLRKSLQETFREDIFSKGSFEIHCTSTGDSHRDGTSLASYICKEGYSRFRDNDLQNFMFPESYIEDEFIEEVLKRECIDMDVQESAAKTVWKAGVRDGRWKDLPQLGT